MTGRLYICATPIGNLKDFTFRAVEVLKEVALIAAEDTRHSKALLSHYDIHTPLTSYHEHNRFEKAEILIERLKGGDDIALISDAGTPVISDPGEVLVKRAREEGIEVLALPGACAMVSALSVSGISGRRFCFEGFLPANNAQRKKLFDELKVERRTIILYEAPHHLKKTLIELRDALGDRTIAISRELTKLYEETGLTTFSEALARYANEDPRGEFVLVIEGLPEEEAVQRQVEKWQDMELSEHLKYYLDKGMDKKQAMKQMAADRNMTRRDIYNGLFCRGEQEEE